MTSTGKDNMEKLRQWLNKEPARNFNDRDAGRLKELLELAWPEIEGNEDTAMAPRKIRQAESMTWDPPNLSFKMERHGAVCCGSVRAEMQLWTVDIESAVATVNTVGGRNVGARSPNFDVAPVARDIVSEVTTRGSRLIRWTKDGTKFQPNFAELPRELSDDAEQTVADRRKRLRGVVAEALAEAGIRYDEKGSWWHLTGG